jgi:hypothetical protein
MKTEESPRKIREYEQNSPKVHACCAISSYGVIGSFFFRENNDTVSATGERYLNMLQNLFLQELQRMRFQPEDITFQHGGAPAHFHQL